MGNRNQDYYNTGRPQNWRDDDQDRGDYGGNYRPEREGNEADAGTRGGSYDQGRVQYGRREQRDRDPQGDWQRRYSRDDQGQRQSNYEGSGGTGYGGGYGGQGYTGGGYGYGGSGRGESGYSRVSDRGWSEPFGEGQQYGQSQSRGRGPHQGKGPKGYQRSDERMKEMICERLREDPDIDPSDVTITVQGGKVTLEGTVDSRQAKNAIEEIAEQFGSQDIQNNLRVQRAAMQSSEAGQRGRSGNEDFASRQKQH